MRFLFAVALAALFIASPTRADTLADPLLSYSCTGAGTGCTQTDNGTFAPLSSAQNWGFEIAPGPQTGSLTLGIFVPTNLIDTTTFALPGLTDNGGALLLALKIAALLNAGDGASIATYLNLPNAADFSPTDNFANLSAGELTENPGFGGNFLSFTVTIPGITLDGNGSTTLLNDFSFGSNLPAGTVIAGFFTIDNCTKNCNVGTAASNDLVITPLASDTTPIPGALWLFAGGLGVLTMLGRRRQRTPIAGRT
jgi:hypothetical protein